MSAHNSSPAFAVGGLPSAASATVAVPRVVAERALRLVEAVLTFAGEAPDRDLIQLQHDLADLLSPARPPSAPPPAHPELPLDNLNSTSQP